MFFEPASPATPSPRMFNTRFWHRQRFDLQRDCRGIAEVVSKHSMPSVAKALQASVDSTSSTVLLELFPPLFLWRTNFHTYVVLAVLCCTALYCTVLYVHAVKSQTVITYSTVQYSTVTWPSFRKSLFFFMEALERHRPLARFERRFTESAILHVVDVFVRHRWFSLPPFAMVSLWDV